MFSEKLVDDDISQTKCCSKKILIISILIPIIIIILIGIAILLFVLLKKDKDKDKDKMVGPYIKDIENYLIADFKLNETNQIINTGLSNTSKVVNYKSENGYFSGGQIKLNSTYNNCTIIAIVKYNKTSKERLFLDFAYYGGAIDFEELTKGNQRIIGIPYAGGQISTRYLFPNHSYINTYYNGKSFAENEDIFFALSTNSLNDENGGKFYVQVNEDYNEKNRWCNNIRNTFGLSSEHQFKEIRIYNVQLPKNNLDEEFKKTKIKFKHLL